MKVHFVIFQNILVDTKSSNYILRGFDFEAALMRHTNKNSASAVLPCMNANRDRLFNSHQNVTVCSMLNLKYTC